MPTTDLTPAGGLLVGNTRTLTADFNTAAGADATVELADVTLTVTSPSGVSTAYTGAALTLAAQGVVTYRLDLDAPGTWAWDFFWTDGTDNLRIDGYVRVRRRITTDPA